MPNRKSANPKSGGPTSDNNGVFSSSWLQSGHSRGSRMETPRRRRRQPTTHSVSETRSQRPSREHPERRAETWRGASHHLPIADPGDGQQVQSANVRQRTDDLPPWSRSRPARARMQPYLRLPRGLSATTEESARSRKMPIRATNIQPSRLLPQKAEVSPRVRAWDICRYAATIRPRQIALTVPAPEPDSRPATVLTAAATSTVGTRRIRLAMIRNGTTCRASCLRREEATRQDRRGRRRR